MRVLQGCPVCDRISGAKLLFRLFFISIGGRREAARERHGETSPAIIGICPFKNGGICPILSVTPVPLREDRTTGHRQNPM